MHFERAWLDPEYGKVFCLSTAPSKEAVMRAHERAGHPAAEVYEISIEVGHDAEHHDVVVVGARCAGAATAMLLARAGHGVVMVDRSAPTTDTNSTHSFVRGGVVQLGALGAAGQHRGERDPRIRSVTFHLDGETIRADVRDKAGVDFLIAPRRYVLDDLVARAAVGAGARLDTVPGCWA